MYWIEHKDHGEAFGRWGWRPARGPFETYEGALSRLDDASTRHARILEWRFPRWPRVLRVVTRP